MELWPVAGERLRGVLSCCVWLVQRHTWRLWGVGRQNTPACVLASARVNLINVESCSWFWAFAGVHVDWLANPAIQPRLRHQPSV
jgi:hypothetical protein